MSVHIGPSVPLGILYMTKVEFQINGETMDYSIIQFLELTSFLVNHELSLSFCTKIDARWNSDINKTGIKLLIYILRWNIQKLIKRKVGIWHYNKISAWEKRLSCSLREMEKEITKMFLVSGSFWARTVFCHIILKIGASNLSLHQSHPEGMFKFCQGFWFSRYG